MGCKVIFSNTLNQEDKDCVSQNTLNILQKIGDLSKNPTVTITSTRRPAIRQAISMYDNEQKGNSIKYSANGREVLMIYEINKKKSKDECIKLMIQKIEELSKKGQLVSKHCVTAEQYAKQNIIDVSLNILNPRDFVRSAEAFNDVSKVITPIEASKISPYLSLNQKIFIDKAEPAIHIEF